MTSKDKRYPTPEFRSPEEEEEYWKTHSPISEGYEGEVKRPRQKRSSFLVVRLSGEELEGLRRLAAKQGLGPSTLARIILTSAIDQVDTAVTRMSPGELKGAAVREPGSPYLSVAEQFVVDHEGKKTGVILPLRDYQKLQEDLHDLAVVAERRSEKPISAAEMKRRLKRDAVL
jgi:hypothetical protein